MGGGPNSSIFVLYAHLSQVFVTLNQQIPANTLIGMTGNTGFSTAEHLHLEVGFGARWGGAIKIHPSFLFNIANA
jgi:murein DD-endopeptidase MepM/ murein hydrolase activator NlpD